MDIRSSAFASNRPLLLSVAYRMLGSVQDAEDIVQETYLRWQAAAELEVREPRAYLTTIVTRLAINHLRSARVQRESYIGPWLPEPLLTTADFDASDAFEVKESLSMGFLVLLERLSPVERAVFLLRDVFELEYVEIAPIVDKSAANCRQLFVRAKRRLGSTSRRFDSDPEHAARLLARFADAVQTGDLGGLLAVLAEDITLWADGGGKVKGAALRPIRGARSVARLMTGIVRRFVPEERDVRTTRINGQPGFIVAADGRILVALILDVAEGRIQTIYAVGNPDKLQALRSAR